ncbi:hypothetical protein PPYR_08618 [Photinus pyralis]|uniref:Cytochrome P450 n=1 Tax=Photinus pyralis TaxID=7054 RepID=A0A5N4AJU1_PHOPY|nr:cytochrome P450 6k1-like [Photinus pyralis]KAB0797625.1 hypothetical protein PPYR_08618 [Photinus pyralis]
MYALYVPLILCLLLAYLAWKYLNGCFKYWQKLNVQYVKPVPFFGNSFQIFTSQVTIGELLGNLYKQFDAAFFGMYMLHKPVLVIRDPELIKKVLVKDFHHFHDRSVLYDEQCDAIASNMLFFSKSPEWKLIRYKVTPLFTTGKLKNMMDLCKEVANDMVSYLRSYDTTNCIDAKELGGRYATDAINSCTFGIKTNSFKSDKVSFYPMCKEILEFDWKTGFSQVAYFIAHGLVKTFKLRFFDYQTSNLLRKVFWDTLNERERTKIVRHDLIDAMIGFKNSPNLTESFQFEGDRILSIAVQVFTAGFETIGSTVSFALYELSIQRDIQEKLRSEINSTFLQYGSFDYLVIKHMRYLHMVVQETLRKYPILPFLERKCAKTYSIPEKNLIIDAGTPIYIPLLGLHYDPKYFKNPDNFDPERFADKKVDKTFYLPFGDGPRGCIGARFSLMAVKVALLYILREFEVKPSPSRTPTKIRFSPYSVFLSPSTGIYLKFKANRVVD